MLNVAIVIGSIRPNRRGEAVGKWVFEQANERGDAAYELIDLKAVNLPFLDEPQPPSTGRYEKEHTKAWSARVSALDAFVFVTPEYNHGVSPALKNALDFLYREWNNKAAGFVGYGGSGAQRSIEHLRGVCAELQMATVRQQVSLVIRTDWENDAFKPGPHNGKALATLFDQVVGWGGALKTLRNQAV